jgi:hypothetical protein
MSMTISDIILYLQNHLSETDITLYSRASEKLISRAEEVLNIRLPDDVKQLYRFANGFESAEDMFRIVPLEEGIDWFESRSKKAFPIAEYMVYCDYWQLEIDNNDYNNYQITNLSANGRIILTQSLAEFLQRFLRGGVFDTGGLYEWHDLLLKVD